MAIALGLESKPVSRLTKVWKKQDPTKIAILKVTPNFLSLPIAIIITDEYIFPLLQKQ